MLTWRWSMVEQYGAWTLTGHQQSRCLEAPYARVREAYSRLGEAEEGLEGGDVRQ